MYYFSKIFLILCTFLFLTYGARLPSYLTPCPDDSQLSACFKAAITTLQEKGLVNGIPDFPVPPMNPLILPKVNLESSQGLNFTFQNLKIYNGDKFTLKYVNFDIPGNEVNMSLRISNMRIVADYEIDGKLLLLQLKGHGIAEMSNSHLDTDMQFKLERFRKGDKEFWKIIKITSLLSFGKSSVMFHDLFGDNKELTDQTNKIINDNIEEILEDLKPAISEVVNQYITVAVNRIFARFPLKTLFP